MNAVWVLKGKYIIFLVNIAKIGFIKYGAFISVKWLYHLFNFINPWSILKTHLIQKWVFNQINDWLAKGGLIISRFGKF